MHILLQLPDDRDDIAIAAEAATQGIGVKALSPLQLTPSHQRGLVLGYGRLPEAKINEATHALAALLKKSGMEHEPQIARPVGGIAGS